jgi:excisionase family DNA binding protein
MMDTQARYLTPAEAATELRVSTDTVLRLIASGALPALRISSRIIRIPVPAFTAFQAGREPAHRVVVRRKRGTEVELGVGESTNDPSTHDLQRA